MNWVESATFPFKFLEIHYHFSLWDYFKTKKLKSGDNFLTAILSIIIFLAIYLPVQALLGDVFIITLIIMFIAICFSVYFSSRFFKFDKNNLKYFGILLIVISYFSFSYFTYNPPKEGIFIDTTNNSYGITKKEVK